jgi:hypothetical protein
MFEANGNGSGRCRFSFKRKNTFQVSMQAFRYGRKTAFARRQIKFLNE